jgi:hypothetical protein
MPDIKRLHYFNHQFLNEQDFRAEQSYHLEMRRRHNRLLHSWGIADGLTVDQSGDREITINPGTAVDAHGREIVLDYAVKREVSGHPANGQVFVTIEHVERFDDEDRQSTGDVRDFTRVTERADIDLRRHQPPGDGAVITLARVYLDGDSAIREVDYSLRHPASSRVGLGMIGSDELADEAVTPDKLSDELRARLSTRRGWVRLPFKPFPIERVRILPDQQRVRDTVPDPRGQFILEIGHARCGPEGGRGTMGIPTPPGARRVTGLRIAGWTRAVVNVALYRSGWNRQGNTCQEVEITRLNIDPPREENFDRYARNLDQRIDDDDAIAIVVVAAGESRIYLIGTEFE